MRLVIALGGNALLRRGEQPDVGVQRAHVRDAVAALAPIVHHHEVIVTHGNGPQVGLLAERLNDPLDVLGAESEGLIGYLLELELHNALPARAVATLLTQTLVAADDPAFAHPTKPIGLAGPDGRRRLVPSPEPQAIVELPAVRALLDAGILVICGGGGGVPVVADDAGRLTGIEGVVDKDLAAALLAEAIGADGLLLLTDVAAVFTGFGTPDARPLPLLTARDLTRLDLAEGSMGPKVLAAVRFAERTGGFAAIGALEEAVAILAGERGTRVVSERAAAHVAARGAGSHGAAAGRRE